MSSDGVQPITPAVVDVSTVTAPAFTTSRASRRFNDFCALWATAYKEKADVDEGAVKVYPTFAVDPTNFTVQLDPQLANKISSRLSEYYEPTMRMQRGEPALQPIPSVFLKKGLPCVCQYTDDLKQTLWYRGIVDVVERNGCLINYVDWGNQTFQPYDAILPLHPNFAQEPPMAYRCTCLGLETCRVGEDVAERFRADILGAGGSLICTFKTTYEPYVVLAYSSNTGRSLNRDYMPSASREDSANLNADALTELTGDCVCEGNGEVLAVFLDHALISAKLGGHIDQLTMNRSTRLRGRPLAVTENLSTLLRAGEKVSFVACHTENGWFATSVMPYSSIKPCAPVQVLLPELKKPPVQEKHHPALHGRRTTAPSVVPHKSAALQAQQHSQPLDEQFGGSDGSKEIRTGYGLVANALDTYGFIVSERDGEIYFHKDCLSDDIKVKMRLQDGSNYFLKEVLDIGRTVKYVAVKNTARDVNPICEWKAVSVELYGSMRFGVGTISRMEPRYGIIVAAGFGYVLFPHSAAVSIAERNVPMTRWFGGTVHFRATEEIPGKPHKWRATSVELVSEDPKALVERADLNRMHKPIARRIPCKMPAVATFYSAMEVLATANQACMGDDQLSVSQQGSEPVVTAEQQRREIERDDDIIERLANDDALLDMWLKLVDRIPTLAIRVLGDSQANI